MAFEKHSLVPLLGFLLILILVWVVIYYFFLPLPDPALADPYVSRLETLNDKIYRALPTTIESLRLEVQELKNEINEDGAYQQYVSLTHAQLSTLDALEGYYIYVDEAREYYSNGIDCEKDYSDIISELKSGEAKVSTAVTKINGYVSTNPNLCCPELTSSR